MTKRGWVPVSTSPKGRLAVQALEDFGRHGFQEVTVSAVAAGAGVTTGALYHHFEGKLGLYSFVRDEAERRLLDRMAGAAAAAGEGRAVQAALLIGFDFAVGQAFGRMLGEPHPARELDPVADLLQSLCPDGRAPLGAVLAAAWRAALTAAATTGTPEAARRTIERLQVTG